MGHWTEVKRIPNLTGDRRMLVLTDRGELFRFDEETYVSQDGYAFWTCTHMSGVYDSARAAERDARMQLPWLRGNPFPE